ncbi:MAG: ATP-binding protein [Phenylobacterium sp.]|uniref:ATP-binding protein n=1 Tax=Phenylobacterium sp. TaxID=1871053 RepID=UPI00391A5E9C
MRFQNLKAPLKISVGLGAVLASILGVGAVLFVNFSALERADAEMTRSTRALHALEDARFALARQENSLRGYLISKDAYYLDRITHLHRPTFFARVAELERLSAEEPQTLANIARLRSTFEDWRLGAADRVAALAADPAKGAEAAAMIGHARPADTLMGRAEASLGVIEASARADVARQAAIKARAARNIKLAWAIGVSLTAAVACAVGVVLWTSMASPIVALTQVMRRLASGDNAVKVPAVRRQDEIGLMAAAIATFRDAAVAKAALEAEAEVRRRESLTLADQARAASRAKSEFLATMTHELRTPLNGILGMAHIMAAGGLEPQQRERLETIEESGRALLGVINDILDISKIEAGRLEIRPAPFDLGKFADNLAALYRPLAAEKGLEFTMDVCPDARGWFLGDAVRLRQVASNLISNALKFTAKGEVRVSLVRVGERLVFAVSDTGLGIPADQQERLFERFVQVDGSATRRYGGAGLGLAISKEIIGLLGGTIAFTSREGEGSRFAFEVPLPSAQAPAAPAETQAEDGGGGEALRVLVVDDNATNRMVLTALLNQFGVESHCVTDGRAALAAWESGSWDAILMDIHMPEMDGVTATLRIREREHELGRPRTPIIAVTASVLTHETESYLSAGMDDCVPKPVEVRSIMAALQGVLAEAADA